MATAVSNKLFVTDIASDTTRLPSNYIRPISDRPNIADVESSDLSNIPLIDLKGVNEPGRARVVDEIRLACQNYGFFQVKNHGIPEEVIEAMLRIAREFFKLPESERLKSYSNDPTKATRLSTSFNVSAEKVSNWRDFLRLHCYPLEEFVHEWPSNPPSFKKVVGDYATRARELALRLLELISESLGLDKDFLVNSLGKQAQHMAINYYPPCPQPELTYGLPGHKDPNALTLLLQDEVPGLQVLKENKWVAVSPVPNTLVINIGDQIQALSNDRYKSVLHRAIVNSESERISVPTFYCSSPDTVIEPAEVLIDDKNPRVYKTFTYGEYYHTFWKCGLQYASCLDLFKT